MSETLFAVIERLMDELGDKIAVDVPMGSLTTYRVGGRAAAMVVIDDHDTLSRVAAAVAGTGIPVRTLGLGSNMLVADRGFHGLVVHMAGDYAAINVVDETVVIAGAAAKLPVVARTTVGYGLTGFEWAVGVPGSIGGAVRMNAGGHGAEMRDAVMDADIVDFAAAKSTQQTILHSGVAHTVPSPDFGTSNVAANYGSNIWVRSEQRVSLNYHQHQRGMIVEH